jgi:hypothetical protein
MFLADSPILTFSFMSTSALEGTLEKEKIGKPMGSVNFPKRLLLPVKPLSKIDY